MTLIPKIFPLMSYYRKACLNINHVNNNKLEKEIKFFLKCKISFLRFTKCSYKSRDNT